MKVEITLSALAVQMFGDTARRRIEQLVEAEALRLWHVERSRPKDKVAQAVGRPKLSADEKMVKVLAAQLRGTYNRLKEMYGPDFEKAFGTQEAALEDAVARQDLNELIRINTEQPWVRRKGESNGNS